MCLGIARFDRLVLISKKHIFYSVAWSIQTGSDTIMRKMSKISSDREQCYRLSKEITILQSLQHENVTWFCEALSNIFLFFFARLDCLAHGRLCQSL